MLKMLYVIHDEQNLRDFYNHTPWLLNCQIFVKLNNEALQNRLDPSICLSKNYENLGYFGGFRQLINEFNITGNFIICNCDVFIKQIEVDHIYKNWVNRNCIIGPAIISPNEKFVQPPALFRSIYKTLFLRLDPAVIQCEIKVDYLAGSILFFGVNLNCDILLSYPYCLYCEEVYLSNTARDNGVQLFFDPDIRVLHHYDEIDRVKNNFRSRHVRKNLFRLILKYETRLSMSLPILNWARLVLIGKI